MKSYSSNTGFRLIAELRTLRDFHFEQRCGAIMQTVFPTLTRTPARSAFDRAGIDHCMFAEHQDELLLTVQCKGFDVQEFGSVQLAQCLDSIASFAGSSFRTKKHLLIVNRIVRGQPREKIETDLQALLQAKKTEQVQLLDLEAFLEMIFQEAQRQLLQVFNKSLIDFQEQHRLRMAEDIYLEEVPFHTANEQHENPLKF